MEVFNWSPRDVYGCLFRWRESPNIAVGLTFPPYHDPSLNSHSIESPPIAGNSFVQAHPDWNEGTYEKFKVWSQTQLGLKESESDDDGEVPVHYLKAKDIQFEENVEGNFILPPLKNFRTVREKQRVVRGYIGAVYRMLIRPILLFSF
jgi:hypothetical protein